jgi:hypothetical protein
MRHLATRLLANAAQALAKANGGSLELNGPGWNSVTVYMVA